MAATVEGFPSSVFAERRDRVLQELGSGAMVVPAGPVLHRSGDTELPYRPDSELFYLTGFAEPGALLLLRGFADSDRVVLYVRPRDPDAERWSGPRLGPEAAADALGVESARPIDSFGDELPALLGGADRIYFRLGASSGVEERVVAALRTARSKGVRTGAGPRSVIDPGVILDDMRVRKDSFEIEAIRRACGVTVAGFNQAISSVAPGVGEWELEAAMDGTFRKLGGTGSAFETIVGSGENACVLHYTANARTLGDGDLVLLDAGAEVGMYSGDVSRTVPASGRFTAPQRDVYRIVERAREEAVAAIRPGVRFGEVHLAAVRVIVEGLRDIGVLEGAMEELLETEAHKPFFPHRTSHWLGLDTHDVGGYGAGGRSRVLEEGMVMTVEPGLYFPTEAEAHGFGGIGVRIEDDVLVTENGSEILNTGLPTDEHEIEDLVGAGAG